MGESIDKVYLHELAANLLTNKVKGIQKQLDALREGLLSDSKSSAGDKHETSRAKTQLEIEQISKQLSNLHQQQRVLDSIDPTRPCTLVSKGALIKTDKLTMYFATGIGKIKEANVFVLSDQSPIAQACFGKQKGDSFTVNGNRHTIEGLW